MRATVEHLITRDRASIIRRRTAETGRRVPLRVAPRPQGPITSTTTGTSTPPAPFSKSSPDAASTMPWSPTSPGPSECRISIAPSAQGGRRRHFAAPGLSHVALHARYGPHRTAHAPPRELERPPDPLTRVGATHHQCRYSLPRAESSQRARACTGARWAYGYMWWVWDAPASTGPSWAPTVDAAQAAVHHGSPALDLVIAHKTDTTQASPHSSSRRSRNVSSAEYQATLDLLIAARCPGACN